MQDVFYNIGPKYQLIVLSRNNKGGNQHFATVLFHLHIKGTLGLNTKPKCVSPQPLSVSSQLFH